jgi:O-antigen/teichoic acid export membrane protein
VDRIGELVATVPLRRARGWSEWTRRHLDYGARGVVATLLFEINSRLDVWMLGAVMSDARVGVYSMAASIAEGVLQLSVVLQVNVNPRIAAMIAGGQIADFEALVRRSRRWFVPALAGVCVAGAALFPLAIPMLTGNDAYHDGALPFAILMGGIALASPWLPFNQTLLMASRPGWHTFYISLAVGLNVALNALLIPRLGLEGAAVATACSLVGSAMILRALVRVRVGARI